MSAPDVDYYELGIVKTDISVALVDANAEQTISFSIGERILVVLHGDGRVEYDVPVDEAASAFWSCVEMMARNNGYQFTRT